MTEFSALLAETSQSVKDNGLDFRGKKYLEVSKRVELLRKHYETNAAILTDIIQNGTTQGEVIVIKATVKIAGEIVATGHASEVVGAGNVNKASALENAETSAIGRALAALGIHGGEYASSFEMGRIGEKPENVTATALIDAWEGGVLDSLPDDPSAETLAEAYADQMLADVAGYKSAKGVEGYMKKHSKHMNFISEHAPERHGPLRSEAWAKMQELNKGKAA